METEKKVYTKSEHLLGVIKIEDVPKFLTEVKDLAIRRKANRDEICNDGITLYRESFKFLLELYSEAYQMEDAVNNRIASGDYKYGEYCRD